MPGMSEVMAWRTMPLVCTSDRARKSVHTIVNAARTIAYATAVGYLAELKRFSISGQFTTLHQAAMYSGRRF